MKCSIAFLAGVAFVFALGFLALAIRLYQIQIVDAGNAGKDFSLQSTRIMQTPGLRGRILDRKGRVLAGERVRRDLVCRPEAVKSTTISNAVLTLEREIGRAMNLIDAPNRITAERVMRHLKRESAVPLTVFEGLDETRFARLQERHADFPAFDVEIRGVRDYPYGSLAAHVLGHVGQERPNAETGDQKIHYYDKEATGRAGLEAYYNRYLSGVSGETKVRVNARGFAVDDEIARKPVDGIDLATTLDVEWQYALERELAGVTGAGVVLDARTGAIRAIASSPTFDPNHYQTGVPEFNKALSGTYAPGSTFKPIVALAALERGWDTNTVLSCDGVYMQTKCTARWGHGPINLNEAIRESCNSFFLQLGIAAGGEAVLEMARLFGLGEKSGVDLGGEADGNLEPWTFQSAMGQGPLLVTPLQMAVVAAALGNGGRVFRPFLHTTSKATPSPVRTLNAKPENLAAVRHAMKAVVDVGSARKAFHPIVGGKRRRLRVDAGGKTGSAEKASAAGRYKNTWFIAFAPFDDPEVAVAMVVEHGEFGGTTVAPRVYNILKRFYGETEDVRK